MVYSSSTTSTSSSSSSSRLGGLGEDRGVFGAELTENEMLGVVGWGDKFHSQPRCSRTARVKGLSARAEGALDTRPALFVAEAAQ